MQSFTSTKLLWLKRNRRDEYDRLEHVALPHDYLNFILTGAARCNSSPACAHSFAPFWAGCCTFPRVFTPHPTSKTDQSLILISIRTLILSQASL